MDYGERHYSWEVLRSEIAATEYVGDSTIHVGVIMHWLIEDQT